MMALAQTIVIKPLNDGRLLAADRQVSTQLRLTIGPRALFGGERGMGERAGARVLLEGRDEPAN